MSENETRNVSLQKLLGIIDRIRKYISRDEESTDCQPVAWDKPYHYLPCEIQQIEQVHLQIADAVKAAVDKACSDDLQITPAGIEQSYAGSMAKKSDSEFRNYSYLTFSYNKQLCGFISLSPSACGSLVGFVFRDHESPSQSDQELSSLEETILTDIANGLANAITAFFKESASIQLQHATILTRDGLPVELEEFADLTSLGFTVASSNADCRLDIIMQSDIFDILLGKENRFTSTPAKHNASAAIISSVEQTHLGLGAVLAYDRISLDDMLSLKQGDVFVLEKTIDQPLDVSVNNRFCLKAHLASMEGKYALVIAESEDEPRL